MKGSCIYAAGMLLKTGKSWKKKKKENPLLFVLAAIGKILTDTNEKEGSDTRRHL